jgi:hypothetical protein
MTTGLFTHESCFDHITPPGHREQFGRMRAVLGSLGAPAFAAAP